MCTGNEILRWCNCYAKVWRFLKKLKIGLPYDLAVPLLGIYLPIKRTELGSLVFFSHYFGNGVSLFALGWLGSRSSYFMLPAIAGMTGVFHHISFFLLKSWGDRVSYCPGLAWKYSPPNFSLPFMCHLD
jgi:hypothetical protein